MGVSWHTTVELPSQWEVERQLVMYLHKCKDWVEPSSVYAPLADVLNLSAAQRIADRREPEWHNLVQWARKRLVRKRQLDNSRPGYWRLTLAGHEEAQRLECTKLSLQSRPIS